ncbi:MAG: hypothetical protein LBE85_04355 [Candidatus Accumulibacter sp.]|jgi:hypothetical protein|nr:hypothetical protein [Accumulibacter sp.]
MTHDTIILAEIEYLDEFHSPAAPRLLRVSSRPYCTGRGDAPPDTAFMPLLAAAPQLSVAVFADGRGGGAARRDVGKISLVNANGRLDWLLYVPVDGRAVTIRVGPGGGRYPEDFTVWMRAAAAGVEAPNRQHIDILVRDGMAVLDVPLAGNTYAGTNAPPLGVEGTADDIKGRAKPRLFGRCDNLTPVCVNTSKLIHQINDGAARILAVYDRGAALTREADYAGLDDMMTNAPGEGAWRAWPEGGMLRFGSAVTIPTVDAMDDPDGGVLGGNTAARVIARIAAAAGVSADTGELAALDALQPGEVGVYVEAGTARQAIDELAGGIGAWVGVGSEGELRMGRLDAPDSAPSARLDDSIITDLRVQAGRDNGDLPAHRITLNYGRNWTRIAASQVAGSVPEERAAWLAQEYRASTWEDADVLAAHPLAPSLERNTALRLEADAIAESERLAALHGVRRMRLRLTVPWMALAGRVRLPAIGDTLRVTHCRYGLTAGKNMRVISVETRAASGNVILGLWG